MHGCADFGVNLYLRALSARLPQFVNQYEQSLTESFGRRTVSTMSLLVSRNGTSGWLDD